MTGHYPYPEKKPAAHLLAELIAVVDFFKSLRGPVRSRVPPDPADIPVVAKRCLDAVTSLTMLHSEALARVLDGQAALSAATRPPASNDWLRQTVFDNPPRVTARVATRRLHSLLDSLTSSLAYLTDDELRNTPPTNDLVQAIVLSAAAIDHLVDFLDLELIRRAWPDTRLGKGPL